MVEAAVAGVATAVEVAAEATAETFLPAQAYANVTRYCAPAQRSTTQTKRLTVS